MTIRNKTTNIYTEWLPLIEGLPNEIAGVMFKNILKYQNGDDIQNDFPVWLFIKSKIDEYNNRLAQISEKRRENGKLGGLAKASNCYQMLANDSKSSNKTKENKIKQNKTKENNNKPSLQEVINYCQERNNGVDANKWFDYYTANGWKVGRNPMKDWKATVRTWERNESKPANKEKTDYVEEGKFFIDPDAPEYKDLFESVANKQELANNVWDWIYKNFAYQEVKISFVRGMIEKFKKGGV